MTALSLHYILQAAMGQCSTLRVDLRRTGESSGQDIVPSINQTKHKSCGQSNTTLAANIHLSGEQHDVNLHHSQHGDNNKERHNDKHTVMDDIPNTVSDHSSTPLRILRQHKVHTNANVNRSFQISDSFMVNKVKRKNLIHQHDNSGNYLPWTEKVRKEKECNFSHRSVEKDPESNAKGSKKQQLPLPTDGVIRTRCYRLNLDSPGVLSSSYNHLGPMTYDDPYSRFSNHNNLYSCHSTIDTITSLKVSDSDDHSTGSEKSEKKVAISTARIFRGIAVDKNGTIMSQNGRSFRSSRGKVKQAKQGEKSRQAETIDKANDLVDGTLNNYGKENDGVKSKIVSLVIIGEYDDMKQLVQDGAKKIRDAAGLPDDVLLATNRPRQKTHKIFGCNATNDQLSSSASSRKRFSFHTPHNIDHSKPEFNTNSGTNNRLQYMLSQSAPPKLKVHPRDRPRSRRLHERGDDGANKEKKNRVPPQKCNNNTFFRQGDNDWSDGLNFSKGFNSVWNCGPTRIIPSTMSHTTTISPLNGVPIRKTYPKVQFEKKNEFNSNISRGGEFVIEHDFF